MKHDTAVNKLAGGFESSTQSASKTKASSIKSLLRAPRKRLIDHFTFFCSVMWPLNDSEAEGDLVLIQTSLLLSCKSSYFNAYYVHLHNKSR